MKPAKLGWFFCLLITVALIFNGCSAFSTLENPLHNVTTKEQPQFQKARKPLI